MATNDRDTGNIMKQPATIAFLTAHRYDQGGGCLIWPFSNPNGYGMFGRTIADKKVMFYAHRVMCEMVHGPAPSPNHEASHECGNGHLGCVHPQHVVWKTKSQNQLDRARHGRKNQGPVGKLTQAKARDIRALRNNFTQQQLANMFGVSRSNISFILNGKLWPEVRKRRRAVSRSLHSSAMSEK